MDSLVDGRLSSGRPVEVDRVDQSQSRGLFSKEVYSDSVVQRELKRVLPTLVTFILYDNNLNLSKFVQGGAQAGGGSEATQKLEIELEVHKQELDKAHEDLKRSQEEMERLLQLVQMSQEEHNQKDKAISDLQQ